MVTINLLDAKRKEIVERQLKIEKLFKIFSGVIGVLGVLIVGVVVINVWTGREIESVVEQVKLKNMELVGYEHVAEESHAVAQKLAAVEEILPSRKLLNQKLKVFTDVYQRDFDLSSIDFKGGGEPGSFGVGGTLESVVSVIELNEELIKLADDYKLKRLQLASLNRSDLWSYQINYLLSLDEQYVESDVGDDK